VIGRATLALIGAVAVLAGCGGEGDDREQVQQTVRDFVDATKKHDSKAFCEDLVTQEFLERSTGATGENAKESCREQFSRLKGLSVELVRIGETRVEGDSARVRAVLRTQGQVQDQVLRLRKEDGDWRLTGNPGG
jgi:ABC-type glycerol-3-phosphate transport system substrate-binding protein